MHRKGASAAAILPSSHQVVKRYEQYARGEYVREGLRLLRDELVCDEGEHGENAQGPSKPGIGGLPNDVRRAALGGITVRFHSPWNSRSVKAEAL
jgi:hypothetical protein